MNTCKICFATVDAGHESDHEQWHAYVERRMVRIETDVNALGSGN